MGYVYIFQRGDDHYFTIGRTRGNVEQRRRVLSTGSPRPLKVFDILETSQDALLGKYVEKKLHEYRQQESDAQEYYAVDPDILRDTLVEAKEFIVDYVAREKAATEYSSVEPTGEILPQSEQALSIYKELRRVKSEITSLNIEKSYLENRLKELIGDSLGIEGIATWYPQERIDLDKARLKDEMPEMFEKFAKHIKFRMLRLR